MAKILWVVLGLGWAGSAVWADTTVPALVYRVDDAGSTVQDSNPMTVGAVEVPADSEAGFIPALASQGDLVVFDTDGDTVAQAIDAMPEEAKDHLAEIRVQDPSTASDADPKIRYTLAGIKRAGILISASTTVASVMVYISAQFATSHHPWVSALAGTGVSILLTTFYTAKQTGVSKYINGVGKWGLDQFQKIKKSTKLGKTERFVFESGKFVAVIPLALLTTCLFVLAIDYDHLGKNFATWSGWLNIIMATGSGFSSNVAWDLYEARVRELGNESERSEMLARSSMGFRQIFGSLLGPLVLVPHVHTAAQAIFFVHGALGFTALALDKRAIALNDKILDHMEKSERVSAALARFLNLEAKARGLATRFFETAAWRPGKSKCVDLL